MCKYNEWTIIREIEKKNGMRRVLAKCSCGKEKEVYLKHLKSGASKSCGHNKINNMSKVGKNNKTHGLYGSRLYDTYHNMIRRCYNSKDHAYIRYGERGIRVCDEWKNDIRCFYDWAINNGYNNKLTIDRIDNNGNYEPSNCRWVTYKQQANNTRNKLGKRFLTLNNETHSVKEWCEILNINYSTLSCRINKLGWSDEKALTYKKGGNNYGTNK